MSAYIDQLPYAEKLATLTQLYLELSLPLENALRAAEADLCHIYRPIRPFFKNLKKYCGCLGSQPELIKDALHSHANGFVVPIDGSGILRAA